MKLKNYLEFLMGQEDLVEKIVNVSGAIIIKNGEHNKKMLLLIQRSKEDHWPFIWEFPRGKCDKGDSKKLVECLKREVKEETGLDVIPIKYIDKYEYIADKGKRKSIQYNYLCKIKNENQKVKLSKEHDNFMWVESMGQCELLVPSEMKKTISRIFNRDIQIIDYPEKDEKIEE